MNTAVLEYYTLPTNTNMVVDDHFIKRNQRKWSI